MICPEHLHPGDPVAIAATARKVSPEEMQPAIRLLESWGLQVIIPQKLYSEEHQMAGDDNTRASVLQQLIDDDTIKAIFCARGGYGTVRIIDSVDFSHLLSHPKWIVGYSDVTVLHSHLHKLGLETLHAIMPINIPEDAHRHPYPATETLHKVLFGESIDYNFDAHGLNRPGTAEAPIVGGNLSILYSLCGSPSDIDTDGKILFIEDLDEYLYHIDRMMQNLKRCGKLSHLAGLLVGAMSDMHDNTIPFGKSAEEIIHEATKEYDYPVCFNIPVGHIGEQNRTLCLGRKTNMVVSKDLSCQLTF